MLEPNWPLFLGFDLNQFVGATIHNKGHLGSETNIVPEKNAIPKGKNCLPTIDFQVRKC